jgi:peptide chain release factor 1
MEYDKRLYDFLQSISDKYDSLNNELEKADLSVSRVTEINKEIKRIGDIQIKFGPYKSIINEGISNENYLLNDGSDDELKEIVKSELAEIKEKIPALESQLKIMLLPKDPYDDKNIIVEMRPAAGGDEASIFTADLFETYKNYFERLG